MRRFAPLLAATALLAALPATAAAARVPATPMVLPGDATAASVRTDRSSWLVGSVPGSRAARIARAHGAVPVLAGSWKAPARRARALAGALRAQGLLTYAEPNRLATLKQRQVADDPLTSRSRWRDTVIDPLLTPPAVLPSSPLLALVDARADVTHPEFSRGAHVGVLPGNAVTIGHGTATLATAAAPANGIGMVGAWPGMRALNVPLPGAGISCADSAAGVRRAVRNGAKVINMSYGSGDFCQTEYQALQLATRSNVVLVAAAGNEFDQGNPLEFPASLPHVLTVGALTPDNKAAYFSNANAAMDLVAPGVGIITAVPPSLRPPEGDRSGYLAEDGTSFSAPIVAAAAAWLRQVRPGLRADQIAQAIRLSATDINSKGFDSSTGFGKLNLAAALVKDPPPYAPDPADPRKPTPVSDPQEPNEDIPYVNGRRFGKPNAAIYKGRGVTRLSALIDYYEDPADVYRIRVPRRSSVTVSTRPSFGNPDLSLYSRKARHAGMKRSRHRLARSRHSGMRVDTVHYRNPRSRSVVVFAYVSNTPGRKTTLDAGYVIRVARR